MFIVLLKSRPSLTSVVRLIFENCVLLSIVSHVSSDAYCGNPAVPINARVSVSSNSFKEGSIATYTCDDGYELFGSSTAVCLANGLWSGELPFCGLNIAVRKPTNQSSTVRGGPPTNANDGDKTTVHDGKRCTETMKESSPWWQVDLLNPYPIKAIKVTSRGCCGHQPLQDLEIRVGNSSVELQRNPLCAWSPGTIEEGVTRTFYCARTLIGQHVFLQLVGSEGTLSLCEVEVFTTDEFSNDRCASVAVSNDVDTVSFNQMCYEFNFGKGGSFEEARRRCQKNGGDLAHGFRGVTTSFLTGELERRKEKLKTQLVWIGAEKDPGLTSRTWRWVNGEVISKPSWGKDQPNNYNGEQNCVVLDGGRNWLWNDVGCNLDYLHFICQHKPASCGSPDKKVNTTVIGNEQSIGAVIRYQCPTDYVLVGDENRTCMEDGFWSGRAPSCLYVNCGPLNSIEHGTITLVDNRTTYGAKAMFKCEANYTLIGNDVQTCGAEGIWSGLHPQCLYNWCSDPPQLHGGVVHVSGKRTGSKAVYSCHPGYILFGHQELTCGIGGEWSGKAPTCKFVDCGAPAAIDNGRYNLVNGSTTFASIVEYTCNEDYWLEPQNRRRQTCTRDGNWSSEAPVCELITCGEPDVPPGGYVVGYDFNVHSSIQFHCEAGYLLVGQNVLECTTRGEWNGIPPTCQYIDCGKLTPIPYGSINYLNNTTHLDSEIVYSCTANYRLAGSPVRKCMENQAWSGTAAKCEEIRCPEPVIPTHSIISVTGNDRAYGRTLIRTSNDASSITTYKIGALVKYRCERGYKMVGNPLSTCEDNGQWTGDVPQCLYVDCSEPPEIPNGHFTLASNVTYYGAAVLYECDPHYEIDGHARRLCLENGTWSSETPSCKEILCDQPHTVDGLTVKVTKFSIGGIAQYSCPKGYYIEGNATRKCQSNGDWSGKTPVCTPIVCDYPNAIENGRVITVNQSLVYNSMVEYHCIPRYERVGPFLRKCTDNGNWSGEEPRCELKKAESLENQTVPGMILSLGVAALFLLVLVGLIYLRLRKAKPLKNTENVQAANTKEEEGAAAMSYASLSDGNASNIYEHIPENQDSIYDSPYEGLSQYEPSPSLNRANGCATVTINGVAVR